MPAQVRELLKLEAEAESELTCQRARNVRAGWIDESCGLLEIGRSDDGSHIVAVIRTVRQIEGLRHDLQVGFFTNLEVLAQAGVQLKEGVTTQ